MNYLQRLLKETLKQKYVDETVKDAAFVAEFNAKQMILLGMCELVVDD
jgi:hypothetical protein